LRPLEPIVTWEVALPFFRRPSGTLISTSKNFPSILGSVVKEPATVAPPPSIRVSRESAHFPVEENYLFSLFLSLLLRASIGVNNFNLMEKPLNLSFRMLPFSNASRVRADGVAFGRDRES
jgi:hypothetical protein